MAQKAIIDFSKRNVTVTKSMRVPGTTIWMTGIGLSFIGWGLYRWVMHRGDADWFIIVIGAFLLFGAANIYRLTKKVTRDP